MQKVARLSVRYNEKPSHPSPYLEIAYVYLLGSGANPELDFGGLNCLFHMKTV